MLQNHSKPTSWWTIMDYLRIGLREHCKNIDLGVEKRWQTCQPTADIRGIKHKIHINAWYMGLTNSSKISICKPSKKKIRHFDPFDPFDPIWMWHTCHFIIQKLDPWGPPAWRPDPAWRSLQPALRGRVAPPGEQLGWVKVAVYDGLICLSKLYDDLCQNDVVIAWIYANLCICVFSLSLCLFFRMHVEAMEAICVRILKYIYIYICIYIYIYYDIKNIVHSMTWHDTTRHDMTWT